MRPLSRLPARRRSPRRPLPTVVGLVLLAACGGDSTGPGSGPGSGPGTVAITLAPVAAVVSQHQVTSVTVRGARVAAQSYQGTVGGVAMTAGRVDDSTVALVVPGTVAPGDHPLRLRIDGADVAATVRVAAAPALPDPGAYLEGVDSLFRSRVAASFTAAMVIPATAASEARLSALALDRVRPAAALDTARALFDGMTPDEQREAASIVLASYGAAPSGAPQARRASLAGIFGGIDPEVCEEDPRVFPFSVEEVEFCAERRRDRATWWEKSTEECDADKQTAAQRGLRARIRNFLWQVVNGCHYSSLSAWAAETWATIEFPTLPEFDPFKQFEEFDSSSRVASGDPRGPGGANVSRVGAPTAAASAAAVPLRFSPGQATVLTPRVRFRTMAAGDVGKVPAATERAQALSAQAAAWQKLNAMLGTGLTQAPPTMNDAVATTPRPLRFPLSRLRLGAISPATVRGTAAIVDDRWTLTFDADERAADVPFTFDVIYDGGRYGVDTMTVSAVLGGIPNRFVGTFDGEGIANSYKADGSFACQWYYTIAGATATAEYGPAASASADRTVAITVTGTYKRDPMHGSRDNPSCPAGTGSFSETITGTATGPDRRFVLAQRKLLDWPTTDWTGGIYLQSGGYRMGASVRLSGFGGSIYTGSAKMVPAAGQ